MRVTENRLMEITRRANADARSETAQASEELTSGVRVKKASDDPLAWADGAKAAAKTALVEARGDGIERALDRLNLTDSALSDISEQMQSAYELAVQMGNGTINAEDRSTAAQRVQEIIEQVISSANSKGVDGDYLFAGSRTDAPAFDSGGLYAGDGTPLQVATGANASATAGVVGSDFDPIAVLRNLQDALSNNSISDVSTSVGEIRGALDRLGQTRAAVGFRMQQFEQGRDAAGELQQRLGELRSNAIGSDPFDAASRLAQASSKLDTSRILAQQLASMLQR